MEKCAFDWIYRNFILITCLGLVVFTKEESQQYSYECNENGDITLLGLLQNSQVTIIEVSYKNGSLVLPNCTFTADQYGHVVINRSCTNDFQEMRPEVVVVGILEDNSVSSTESSSQTSISSILSPVLSKQNTSISSVMSLSTRDTLVSSSTSTMFTSSTNSLPTTTSIPLSTTLLTMRTTTPTTTTSIPLSTTLLTMRTSTSTTTTSLTAKASTLSIHPRTTSTKTTIATTSMPTTQPTTTTPSTTQPTSPSTAKTTPKSITTQTSTPPHKHTTTQPTTTMKTTTTTKPTPLTTTTTTTTPSTITTTSTNNPTTITISKFRKKRAVKNTIQTYMLTCQQYKNGVIHNILGQLINRDTISLNPVFNSVGRVEMQFKSYRAETEDALKYLPNVSTVFLGDKFFMFLKYIGQQDYKIVPQSCSAYDGGVAVTNSAKPNVSLWSYNRCVSDVARKYHLMHGFEKINDKIIFAELFGFHFVDDADITVECDVMICNKADNSSMCTLPQNDCDRAKLNRRAKRTTNKYVKAVKNLKVMNRRHQYTENSAMNHRQNCLMVLIVVVYGVEYILP